MPADTDRPKTFRCSFTLPRDLAVDIAWVAKRMGVSQSAMLAHILTEPISDIRSLLETIPDTEVQPGEARRFRGASADLVAKRIDEALAAIAAAVPREERQ